MINEELRTATSETIYISYHPPVRNFYAKKIRVCTDGDAVIEEISDDRRFIVRCLGYGNRYKIE